MLFLSKFLTIAYGVSLSVHYFLPLYFFHSLHFTYYQISILLCIVLTTRTIGYGFWSAWVDHREQHLHGVLISLLTSLGAASLVLILSIPPDTWLSWPAAILCMILDGWFFQPLGSLIDGVIIKILGEYKLFYESERRWGKLSLGITALCIGCFLDDDHDFDTLMGTVLIGCVALFLLSLSTTVQPADPLLLGFKLEEQSMETSPLLYHQNVISIDCYDNDFHQQLPSQSYYSTHPYNNYNYNYYYNNNNSNNNNNNNNNSQLHYVTSSLLDSTTYYYRYNNLHGDHLSRISEEDASMLQNVSIHSPKSTTPSICSGSNSLDYLLDNKTFHFTPLIPSNHHFSCQQHQPHQITTPNSSPLSSSSDSSPPISPPLQHHYSQPFNHSSLYYNNNMFSTSSSSPNHSPTTTQSSSSFDTTFMSMTLALLPFPPSDIPMVYLITIFPRFRPHFLQDTTIYTTTNNNNNNNNTNDNNNNNNNNNDNDNNNMNTTLIHSSSSFSILYILASCFLLGMASASMLLFSPVIYRDYFELSMHTVGSLILIGAFSDIIISSYISKIMDRFYIKTIMIVTHLILMSCTILYACLPLGPWWIVICLILLHAIQVAGFQVLWYIASYQVDHLISLISLSSTSSFHIYPEKMLLRGKMSALFSSFGPAFGVLLLGYMEKWGWSITSIYLFNLIYFFTSICISFGWSS
ncbi:unnamed protein product [Cunninghamella blakesleeana]